MLWVAEPPERIAIDDHGMTVLVDVRRDQKTGYFLDQGENETRQPPDHLVSLQFREGKYLKCLVLRRG